MKTRSRRWVAAAGVLIFFLAGASSCQNPEESREAGNAAQDEQQAVSTGFQRLVDSQPIPVFDFSQIRQTVIDAETIQATGSISTTSFYLEGIGLVQWCPSAGSPVADTYEISNGVQYVDIPGDRSRELFPLDQGEPTGVYTGQSAGTWVICLDDNGNPFGVYWEGPVGSTIGVVNGLPPEQRVTVDEITYEFNVGDGEG